MAKRSVHPETTPIGTLVDRGRKAPHPNRVRLRVDQAGLTVRLARSMRPLHEDYELLAAGEEKSGDGKARRMPRDSESTRLCIVCSPDAEPGTAICHANANCSAM
jgi:hypothetical protein